MSWCMRLVKADFILHNIETNIKGLVFLDSILYA